MGCTYRKTEKLTIGEGRKKYNELEIRELVTKALAGKDSALKEALSSISAVLFSTNRSALEAVLASGVEKKHFFEKNAKLKVDGADYLLSWDVVGRLNNSEGKPLYPAYDAEERLEQWRKEWEVEHPDMEWDAVKDDYRDQILKDTLMSTASRRVLNLALNYMKIGAATLDEDKETAKKYYALQLNTFLDNISPYVFNGKTYYKKEDVDKHAIGIPAEVIEKWEKQKEYDMYLKHEDGTPLASAFYDTDSIKTADEWSALQTKIRGAIGAFCTNLNDRMEAAYGEGSTRRVGNFYLNRNEDASMRVASDVHVIGIEGEGEEASVSVVQLAIGSNSNYASWDPAKKERYDAKLALDRASLLSCGVPSSALTMGILPIEFTFGALADGLRIGERHAFMFSEVSRDVQEASKRFISGPIETSVATVTDLQDGLDEMFGGKWDHSGNKKISKDALIERILENPKDEGGGKYYELKKYDAKGKYTTVKCHTREELEREVDSYFAERAGNTAEVVNTIVQTLNTAKRLEGNGAIGTSLLDGVFEIIKDPIIRLQLTNFFRPYLLNNGSWQILTNSTLANLGIIAVWNQQQQIIDYISITGEEIDSVHNFGEGLNGGATTIVGAHRGNDWAIKRNPKVSEATTANLEMLRTLHIVAAGGFYKNCSVGRIACISLADGKSRIANPDRLVGDYRMLKEHCGKLKEVEMPGMASPAQLALLELIDYTRWIPEEGLRKSLVDGIKDLQASTSKLSEGQIHELINKVKDLMHMLESKYPKLKSEITETLDFGQPETLVYAALSQYLVELSGLSMLNEGRFDKFGVRLSEFMLDMSNLWSYNQGRMTADGRQITGFAKGMYLTGAANVPSENARKLLSFVDGSIQLLRSEFNDEAVYIQKATIEFYRQMGVSTPERMIIGDNTALYRDLFVKNANGDVHSDFCVKNPYDMSNDLNPYQREYLKKILWQINKYRLKLSAADMKLGYTKAPENKKVSEAIANGTYFEVPLVQATGWQQIVHAPISDMKKVASQKVKQVQDYVDPRQLTEGQRKNIEKKTQGHNVIPDVLAVSSRERQDFLKDRTTSYWEMNLDTVAMSAAFSALRSRIFTDLMDTVRAYAVVLRTMHFKTGIDVDTLLQFIEEQMKVTLFSEPVIDEELQEVSAAVRFSRHVGSMFSIALRPALWIKEMTIGLARNYSMATANIIKGDPYGMTPSDLAKAEAVMIGHAVEKGGYITMSTRPDIAEFSLINQLNNTYGMANMDANGMVDKLKTDRFGVGAGLSRVAFFFATNPDFQNRMTLLVAMMIHDGSWEAHSVRDGKLHYDMSKDKRFSEFWRYKDDPANKTEEFLKKHPKFLEQKGMYLSMMEEFIKTSWKDDNGNVLTLLDKDGKFNPLPKAYSPSQNHGIKEFADTVYGCYDHEAKMLMEHKFLGLMFFQYKTYWSGMMRRWTARDGMPTSQGHWEQAQDENGDPIYRHMKFTEDGELVVSYTTESTASSENEDVSPLSVWKGDRMEGIAISLAHTLRDVVYATTNSLGITHQKTAAFDSEGKLKKDEEIVTYSSILSDPVRKANVFLGLHDLLIANLFGWLVGWLLFGTDDTKKMKESQAKVAIYNEAQRISSEFGFLNNTLLPFQSWEPPQFSTISRLVSSTERLITNDNYGMSQWLTKNVGPIRDVFGAIQKYS